MLYLSVPVSGIPIVPEHIWKSHVAGLKNYRNMDFPVVGYGPFVLTGYKTNQYAEMTANKDFFLGAPKLRQGGHPLLRQQRRRRGGADERSARPDRRAHPGPVQGHVDKAGHHDLPDAVQRLDGRRDQLRAPRPAPASRSAPATRS